MKTNTVPIVFSQDQYDYMQQQVTANISEEVCGLVAGTQHTAALVLPIENQAHSLDVFLMNPQEQISAFEKIEKSDLKLLAIYHSHPNGPAHPSPKDVEEFRYPGTATIIWSRQENQKWQMKAFSITQHTYIEIPLLIV